MARVLFLLPALDFDPSEAAVSWQVLVNAGHVVRFATPDGRPAVADDTMLTGRGLDLWGQIPLLRNLPLLGLLMQGNRNARQAYAKMIVDPNYVAPQRWDAIDPMAFDALLLPGGHRARGMRNYLESDILQRLVAHFFDEEKPVAAICHGVLLAARSISKRTGRSVLNGYRTTALTWAFESSAWSVTRITRFWDPNYYRTYLERDGQPKGFMSVQQEVTRSLARARFPRRPQDRSALSSKDEQSGQREPNQAANIFHQPRASPDSTSLASRIEFPTMTGSAIGSNRSTCARGAPSTAPLITQATAQIDMRTGLHLDDRNPAAFI